MTVSRVKTRREWSYAVILRDITLRKRAEEAIQASEAKDLKARQLEKTLADLKQTQLQLVHSEKMYRPPGSWSLQVTREINGSSISSARKTLSPAAYAQPCWKSRMQVAAAGF